VAVAVAVAEVHFFQIPTLAALAALALSLSRSFINV
jgi:hypothetical protein